MLGKHHRIYSFTFFLSVTSLFDIRLPVFIVQLVFLACFITQLIFSTFFVFLRVFFNEWCGRVIHAVR